MLSQAGPDRQRIIEPLPTETFHGESPLERIQSGVFPELAHDVSNLLHHIRNNPEVVSQRPRSLTGDLENFLENLPRNPEILELFKLWEMLKYSPGNPVPLDDLSELQVRNNKEQLLLPTILERASCKLAVEEQTRSSPGRVFCHRVFGEQVNVSRIAEDLVATESVLQTGTDKSTAETRAVQRIRHEIASLRSKLIQQIELIGDPNGFADLGQERLRKSWRDRFHGKIDDAVPYDHAPRYMQRAHEIVTRYTNSYQPLQDRLVKLLYDLPHSSLLRDIFSVTSILEESNKLPPGLIAHSEIFTTLEGSLIVGIDACPGMDLWISPSKLFVLVTTRAMGEGADNRWQRVMTDDHTLNDALGIIKRILSYTSTHGGREVGRGQQRLDSLVQIRSSIEMGVERAVRILRQAVHAPSAIEETPNAHPHDVAARVQEQPLHRGAQRFKFVNDSSSRSENRETE